MRFLTFQKSDHAPPAPPSRRDAGKWPKFR
nr:MAG TPA: hypothetical protein [Caudoviricetes sp.]